MVILILQTHHQMILMIFMPDFGVMIIWGKMVEWGGGIAGGTVQALPVLKKFLLPVAQQMVEYQMLLVFPHYQNYY